MQALTQQNQTLTYADPRTLAFFTQTLTVMSANFRGFSLLFLMVTTGPYNRTQQIHLPLKTSAASRKKVPTCTKLWFVSLKELSKSSIILIKRSSQKVFATFLEATRMLRQHAVLLLVFKCAIKLPKFCYISGHWTIAKCSFSSCFFARPSSNSFFKLKTSIIYSAIVCAIQTYELLWNHARRPMNCFSHKIRRTSKGECCSSLEHTPK